MAWVKLKDFDNMGTDYMSAPMWLKKATEIAKINNWKGATFRRMIKIALVAEAESITQGLDPDNFTSTQAFKEALLGKLVPHTASIKAKQEFQTCVQKAGQPVRKFWAELKYHYTRGFPERAEGLDQDTYLIDCFLQKLADPQVMKAAMRGNPTTYDQALELAESELGGAQSN